MNINTLIIITITFFLTTYLNAQLTNNSTLRPNHSITRKLPKISVAATEKTESPSPSPSPSPPCNYCQTQGSPPPTSQPQPTDFLNMKQYLVYFIIQTFKNIITCDPLNITASWTGYRPCTYTGFYCEAPPDSLNTPTIASIDFNGFHLCAPSIVGFIDKLPDLALFHANSNNFSGHVPDLTGLQYLYELDISNNIHNGPFPLNVLPLNNLVFLDLRYNLFEGVVPASVFNLNVEVLFLNNNFFNQTLPASLGSSPVSYLTLANNEFTGPIPRTIGNLSNSLLEVLFLNNKLCGCLPYEIGLLSNATVFDAGFNQLTGPIPWSFGCLSSVEQLNLAGNLLYGEVPDVLCKLANTSKLENLTLSWNYFTALGQSCRELVKNKVLDVKQNCIWGLPDQRPKSECVKFYKNKNVNCPLLHLHYIPCTLPTCPKTSPESKPVMKSTVRRQSVPAPAPRYMTYHALHGRQGN